MEHIFCYHGKKKETLLWNKGTWSENGIKSHVHRLNTFLIYHSKVFLCLGDGTVNVGDDDDGIGDEDDDAGNHDSAGNY